MHLPVASDILPEYPVRDPSNIADPTNGSTAMLEKTKMSADMKDPRRSEDFEKCSTDGGTRHAHRDRGPSIVQLDIVEVSKDIDNQEGTSDIVNTELGPTPLGSDSPVAHFPSDGNAAGSASNTSEPFGDDKGCGAVFAQPNVEETLLSIVDILSGLATGHDVVFARM